MQVTKTVHDAPIDRVAGSLAAVAFVLHAAVAGRYDVFRDELYFIVCGQHPDFGYADQPPLVPLLSAALYRLGHQTWLLRAPCVLAAAFLPWLAVRFTRLAGGGDAAALAAGIAAIIAPMLMGLLAVFNTTVFDPLIWTAVAYFIARAVLRDDRGALVWAGGIAGIGLEAKYATALWLASLGLGLLLTAERRLLLKRDLWIGAVIAIALALPSIVWQAAYHWPFMELMAAAGAKNARFTAAQFLLNQVKVMNPVLAPLWIAGIVAPFSLSSLKRLRFVSIAFVVTLGLTIIQHGKDYYTAAAYPSMFVLGAIAFEKLVRAAWPRWIYLGSAVAVSAIAAPAALPILPPGILADYLVRLHLMPQQQERSFAGTQLPQVFADQFGWHDLGQEVGAAWGQIPPELRAATGIKVENYGEAAALDIYGVPYHLPPALSGHNQYFLWGLRGQHPTHLLVVQNHPERLAPYCTDMKILGVTSLPNGMAYESGQSIAFCRNVHPSIEVLWPQLKNFN
jgi:4-amino-4-deoxy-L-arabinose transferase-like glycosyltransferase